MVPFYELKYMYYILEILKKKKLIYQDGFRTGNNKIDQN